MRRTLSRTRVVAAAGAALALLAGCTAPLPVASPDPVPPVAPPIVTTEQQQRILKSLATDIAKADKAQSIDPAKPRLTDPAARMRAAQYEAAKKKIPDSVVNLGFVEAGAVVAASSSWPRDYFVVADPPKDAQSYRIYVLSQATPQQNYRMWGWVRTFGGVTLPRTVDAEIGSLPLTDDDERLKVSPKDTIAQYVDVLNKGTKSKYAGNFTKSDELRDVYNQQLTDWSKAVKAVGGKAAWSHKVGSWGVHALQTGDGGGLVASSEIATLTVSIKEGSMEPGAAVAAKAGKKKFSKSLTMQYTTTVLFWVPGAGSKNAIQVLGAERVLTSAEGK